MIKYTPGPWVTNDVGTVQTKNKPEKPHTYYYGGDLSDGDICTLSDGEYISYHSAEEREANANLIAAAPDMRDFIEEITKANGKYPELNGTQIVLDAYKLLAQAEGRTND